MVSMSPCLDLVVHSSGRLVTSILNSGSVAANVAPASANSTNTQRILKLRKVIALAEIDVRSPRPVQSNWAGFANQLGIRETLPLASAMWPSCFDLSLCRVRILRDRVNKTECYHSVTLSLFAFATQASDDVISSFAAIATCSTFTKNLQTFLF